MHIHQIWLNDSPLPEYLRSFTSQWQSKGEYKLWLKQDIAKLGPGCIDLVKKSMETHWLEPTMRYKAASDVLRYFILLKYGGIYVDVDIAPKDAFVVPQSIAMLKRENLFENGVIATIRGHPLMKLAIDESAAHLPAPQNSRPRDYTGPAMIRRLISKHEINVAQIDLSMVSMDQKWRNITGVPM